MKSNLKEFRIHYSWQQGEFAKKIGISKSHMCMLESGKRIPSLDLAFKIADVFCVNIGDIWSI
ncbi:MAG: helix-turn-helix domain-containing protein [Gammaproteobacteria bacterium]|nr:helix-turn-helix domain-containing protein [Gammaproteobacteria bacterium]